MNKDLRFIKAIKVILVSGALFAFAVTCYQFRSGFFKGWSDGGDSVVRSAAYHMPIFENIVIPRSESVAIKGSDGYIFNLKAKYIVSGDAYNQKSPQKKLSFLTGCRVSLILAILVFSMLLLFKLYYFIDESSKGLIFTLDNIDRIKAIGGYCISLSMVLDIVNYYISSEIFSHTELKTTYMFDFNYLLFTVGVVTIVIMYVFRKGYDLNQEQDLTV